MNDMDMQAERRKIYIAALASFAFCAVFVAFCDFLLPKFFDFPVAMIDRIVFTLRADLFVLLWVMIGVRMVSSVRRNSEADIAGAAFGPPSPRIAIPVAFLQNTLEQAVLAIGTHLALATLLHGRGLALIVAAVVLFSIGRLTFYLGYPKGAGGRAFGMVTTALPTLLGFVLAIALMLRGMLT